ILNAGTSSLNFNSTLRGQTVSLSSGTQTFGNLISSNTSSSGLTFSSSFTASLLLINSSGLGSAATVYFAGGSTFTISTFTVSGTNSNHVVLKSTDTNLSWNLNNTSQNSVSWVEVQRSSAVSTGQTIYDTGGIGSAGNLGNNDNWVFGNQPGTVTWTGATNTDFGTASNWSPAEVPDSSNDVTIPNTSNKPLLDQTRT